MVKNNEGSTLKKNIFNNLHKDIEDMIIGKWNHLLRTFNQAIMMN